MADDPRRPADRGGASDTSYARTDNPADPREHRHGPTVHSHDHTGPHDHGDDYEYDEAHDPDTRLPDRP